MNALLSVGFNSHAGIVDKQAVVVESYDRLEIRSIAHARKVHHNAKLWIVENAAYKFSGSLCLIERQRNGQLACSVALTNSDLVFVTEDDLR
jgi:hypothetical protein